MNSNQIKFKKRKPTVAENILKRKHDETLALMNDLNRGKLSDEELERQQAERRRALRLAALAQQKKQAQDSQSRHDGSRSVLERGQSHQHLGGNIQNNINVSVNVTVHNSSESQVLQGSRRRKAASKAANDKKQRTKDIMNTSLSQMLDQQLLQIDKPDGTRNKNVQESMTEDIFHGDRIYLKNGAMAFKPLGMETVLERADESQYGANWREKLKTSASVKKKTKARQTTEQNIAMQQQLDFASAEDFISFPVKRQLDLFVKEEATPTKVSLASLAPAKQAYADSSNFGSQSRSNETIKITPHKSLSKVPSKSSLKRGASPPKQHLLQTEDSRQVHQGLLNLENRLQARSMGMVTPAAETEMGKSIYSRYLPRESSYSPTVKLNLKEPVSGAQINAQPRSIEAPGANPAYARQTTGNSKELARKMREERYDGALQERVHMDTVIEKPMPPMPHKMRSNLTFQPQSKQNELKNLAQKDQRQSVHDDNVSQLAIDYGLHQKNKQRIMNLMALLGKGSGANLDTNISDIDIGDSMSQIGRNHADNSSQSAFSKRKVDLPSGQNMRIQDDVSVGQASSTELGTINVRGSAGNLAEFTKRREMQSTKRTSKMGRAPALESLNNDEYSLRGPEVNKSLLDKSSDSGVDIDVKKLTIEPVSHQNLQRQSLGHLGHKPGHHENLTNIHLINKEAQSTYNVHEQTGKAYLEQSERIRAIMKNTGSSRANFGAKASQSNKRSKYQMVRSSMFNKNPIFDAMDIQIMSEDGGGSQMQGYRSQIARKPGQSGNNDYFSSLGERTGNGYPGGPQFLQDDQSDKQSVRTLNVRSLSNKRLRPINYSSSQIGGSASKDRSGTIRAQSLQFNKSLSYVMIKGKVQPSEKYIYKNMLPYTNAMNYQSVTVKSSVNRHQLVLQQQPVTSPAAGLLNKNLPIKISGEGRPLGKSKKLKGPKMKRTEAQKKRKGQYGDASSLTSKRKGVIMEMEEEYSGSEAGQTVQQFEVPLHKQATWQELESENEQLKSQILNQIAIFEQYLKVAILQHKARVQQEQAMAAKGARNHSVESIFKGARDFEFDDKKQKQQFLRGSTKRNKTLPKKHSMSIQQSLKRGSERSSINVRQSKQSVDTRASLNRNPSAKSMKSRRRASPTRTSLPQYSSQLRNNKHLKSNASLHSVSSTEEPYLHQSVISTNQKASDVKATFKILSKNVTPAKMRAFEHLLPASGEYAIIHQSAHIAHQAWIAKIQKLWRRLDRHRNQEVMRVQNEIKRNKLHIQELTRVNMFEMDVNFADQKMLLEVSDRRTKVDRRLKYSKDQKKIQDLQTRIRDEIGRKKEFDTWGFNNYLIEFRLKIRMTEDVIDCAQRLSVKADAKTQRELDLLQMLRDRTYDDIKYFIDKRDQKPWRHWDKQGFYYKPALENRGLTFVQIKERIEAHLLMIGYLEPRYDQLVKDIPPYNALNSEMIQFVTFAFGNEGWLQVFQIRQLRKLQDKEQHEKQYMMPVDRVRAMEVDPYTLQVEGQVAGSLERQGSDASVEQELQVEDTVATKEPSSWKIRKPENPRTHGKLKTGYEQIIANRHHTQQNQGDAEQPLVQRVDTATESQASAKKAPSQKSAYQEETKQGGFGQRKQSQVSEPVSGFGVNKYEGDVVQHIKDQVQEQDRQDKVQEEVQAIKKSSWLQVLERERKEKADREEKERKSRAARLAILFEDDGAESGDEEGLLDAGAANQDVANYIEKIDTHLQVEKRILEAWHDNDETPEGGPK